MLINQYGNIIDIRKADDIWIVGENGFGRVSISPEEAITLDYYFAVFNDHTYMTKSIGVSYNSITDSYDYENEVFNVEVPKQEYEFFKISIGDTFGNLTVKEVFTEYLYLPETSENPFARDLGIIFFGSVTLTGYITSIKESGDIFFMPDGSSLGDLPVYLSLYGIGWMPNRTATIENTHFSSDIGAIWLGNTFEGYDNIDTSAIPRDSSLVRVEITITDLEMYDCNSGRTSGIFGRIESVSLID